MRFEHNGKQVVRGCIFAGIEMSLEIGQLANQWGEQVERPRVLTKAIRSERVLAGTFDSVVLVRGTSFEHALNGRCNIVSPELFDCFMRRFPVAAHENVEFAVVEICYPFNSGLKLRFNVEARDIGVLLT
jgi:hypothetical protein